ncbi:MAG TPA: tetratricopeptide repeat protein [Gemmatimonadaceae bacterium]|nr:tetratricopeptide repeat protein [Gemmatimonadaceae bacterium]
MTTPTFQDTAPQPKAESFLDWFRINSRLVSIGTVVVLAAAFGVWFYNRSVVLKNENADKKLLAAKQSVGSGNIPLAQTDLQKVADQYAGTSAGAEAGMLLAQLKLDQGDYPGAVATLKDLTARTPSGPYAASLRALLGDAYAQQGKPADAAAEYDRASQLTQMPNERALLLSKVGRAFAAAGNHDKARQAWEALAVQQDNAALAAEARIRLGELLATGAKS